MAEESKGDGAGAGSSAIAGGEVNKDFLEVYTATVNEATAFAESGDLSGALARFLAGEKKTRSGGDSIATAKIAKLMVELCWKAGDLEQLNAHILILCKRRQQSSRAITAVVKTAVEYVPEIADKAERVKLITTLRTVSAGRIFVELERARLTKTLSKIHEDDGDVDQASEILQEVAVETCGAMSKREKADFLLEQLRLTQTQKDFIRTEIVARKVNPKVLAEEGMEELRIKYYNLMIELHTFKKDPMPLCRAWESIYQTHAAMAVRNEQDVGDALKHMILFLCMSPHDNEQHDLLHRVAANKDSDNLPSFKALLTHFTTEEVIPWPLPEQDEFDAFLDRVPGSWSELFHKRVVQHNIRVLSTYYGRITTARFAQLIGQDEEAAEVYLSEMVSTGMVYARIDRPAGIVTFNRPADASGTLTDWGNDIAELLKLVETSCHLINKERMIHAKAEEAGGRRRRRRRRRNQAAAGDSAEGSGAATAE